MTSGKYICCTYCLRPKLNSEVIWYIRISATCIININHSVKAPELLSFLFSLVSDCNFRVADRVRTNNKMSFCHSEVEVYMDYVSSLVDDLPPGIISKDDNLMHWRVHAGDSELTGTYMCTYTLFVFVCLFVCLFFVFVFCFCFCFFFL